MLDFQQQKTSRSGSGRSCSDSGQQQVDGTDFFLGSLAALVFEMTVEDFLTIEILS